MLKTEQSRQNINDKVMKSFENYTNADYKQIAKDIITLSKKEESELYQVLGHALNDLGIQASKKKDVLFERADNETKEVSALKAFNFVANTKSLDEVEAETRGKKFLNDLNLKIQKTICQNQIIIDIINGDATLEDKLVVAIPAILVIIGGGIILGPAYLTLISIALAIIIRIGLSAYCRMELA